VTNCLSDGTAIRRERIRKKIEDLNINSWKRTLVNKMVLRMDKHRMDKHRMDKHRMDKHRMDKHRMDKHRIPKNIFNTKLKVQNPRGREREINRGRVG